MIRNYCLILIFWLFCSSLSAALTLREKISSLLVLGVSNPSVSDVKVEQVLNESVGGVFFVGSKFSSDSMRAYVQFLQENTELPFIIAVDQEGGRVQRLKEAPFMRPAAADLASRSSVMKTYHEAHRVGEALQKIGVNMLLGPCVDVAEPKDLGVIGDRSFSSNPMAVSKYAFAVFKAYDALNLISVPKHFPGHGITLQDSHYTLPFIPSASMKRFYRDLYPFSVLSQLNVPVIMVGHLIIESLDRDFPASLSSSLIEDVLKQQLGFKGIVMSDDLSMGALKKWSLEQRCLLAFKAGCDVLLLQARPSQLKNCLDFLETAVKKGRLSEKQLDVSYQRLQRLRQTFL